ncbi:MAG: hypothetical protein K2L35_04175 [Muribaculaceae bacterium]|nr:hypothetical protein [Muribaculaceae bacterium]
MKLKNLLFAAGASMLMLSACSSDNGKSGDMRTLSDYENVTTADSLLYYYGQLRAVDYWQQASADSTMASRESRDEFLKGLRAGMDAARESRAYTLGLAAGVQISINMKDFADDYKVSYNRQIMLNAIEDGLKNDSAVNPGEANQEFRRILNQLNMQKEEADRAIAIETLAEAAKAGKWQKLSESLYAAPATGNADGAAIKTGDNIGVKVEISNTDGKELDRRNMDSLRVGQGFPGSVTEALLTMKVGETRKFYTTGPEMFGRFTERYNVKPTQVITFTITTMPAVEKKSDDNAASEARAAIKPSAPVKVNR